MGGTMVCIAAVLLGVDARWPALPDGGLQYVIQIEPQVFERLQSGVIEAVGSHVPPDVDDIRSFQIVMGTQRLAKDAPTPMTQSVITQSPILSGVDNTQWIPLSAGGVECRVWITPEMLDHLDESGRLIEGMVPAGVEKLSLFTIGVGTKPPAESFPALDGSNLTDRSESWQPPPEIDPSSSLAPFLPAEPALPPYQADAGSTPISVQPVNHVEAAETTPNESPQEKPDANSTPKKEPVTEGSDELPLTPAVTLLVLFASLAANIFLLWTMRDFRNRYHTLLDRVGEVGDLT